MNANETEKANESITGRFSVNQASDAGANAQCVIQASLPSENIEILSGNASSTVSSGGNNTPYVEGTPTSTIHSQPENQTERYSYVYIVPNCYYIVLTVEG